MTLALEAEINWKEDFKKTKKVFDTIKILMEGKKPTTDFNLYSEILGSKKIKLPVGERVDLIFHLGRLFGRQDMEKIRGLFEKEEKEKHGRMFG